MNQQFVSKIARKCTRVLGVWVLLGLMVSGCSMLSQWQSLHKKATVMERKGNYREAERLYRAAIEDASRFGAPEPAKAKMWADLGGVLFNSRKLRSSADAYRNAIKIYENSDPYSTDLYSTLSMMAVVLERQSDFDGAESYRKKMPELALRLTGPGLFYAGTLASYAIATVKARKIKEGEEAIQQAIDITKRDRPMGERREYGPRVLNAIADYYRERRDFRQAEAFLRKALQEGETLFYPRHGQCIIALQNLMLVLAEEGNADESEKVRLRLNTIITTGTDPEGKEVGKYFDRREGEVRMVPGQKGSVPVRL